MTPAVASAGRVALVAGGLLSLGSVFASGLQFYGVTRSVAALGSLVLLGLAAGGVARPSRALDAAAVLVAGTVAGGLFTVAFEGSSLLAALTWLVLLGSAGALAFGLAGGAPEVDPRLARAVSSLRASGPARSSSPALTGGPAEGWYAQGDGTLRWWDGRDWTDDVRPATGEAH
jgi:hypothetical protein